MFRVFLKSATCVAALSCFSMPAQAVEVYMFKGAGDFSFVNENMHFSRGLNQISEKLNAEGIRSEVRRFGAIDEALRVIRERKPETIALVGHSMGALASMALARNLKGSGTKIVYMALLDIPGPVGVAGENVEWVENYYTINPVYGRLTNVRTHPNAKNIHVSGYIHNRLDDAPKVQNGVLAAIRQVHAADDQETMPQQPEALYVQNASAPQPAYDPQATASVVQRLDVQSNQTQAGNVAPVAPSAAPASVVRPAAQAQTLQPAPALQPAQAFQPTLTSTAAPLQPLAVDDPYVLPSVRPQGLVGEQTPQVQANEQQRVDLQTTASRQARSLVERGRSLLGRAGGYLRSSRTPSQTRMGFDGTGDK